MTSDLIRVAILPGDRPLDVLTRANLVSGTTCSGRGRCGACAVMVCGGRAPVTQADRRLIGSDGIERGVRLGCMLAPGVYDLSPVEASFLVASRRPDQVVASRLLPGPTGPGIAVDIGTTTIQAVAFDGEGMPGTVWETWNLQRRWGMDVMSRVSAMGDPSVVGRLQASALMSVGAVAEKAACEVSPAWIAVVGNTVMHHLAAGLDATPLGLHPFEPGPGGYRWRALRLEGRLPGRLPHARLVPPLAGLVGSDMTATIGLLLARFDDDPWLAIDMGTNCEIALHRGGRIWCTSAPAGPAFEGGGLSWGCAVHEGAVEHVGEGDDGVKLTVVGNADPVGLCGSAAVDVCALLRGRGDLDESGRFRAMPKELRLAPDGPAFNQRDVREIQKAKAAVEVGVRAVLAAASLGATDLRRVVLAGAFGTGIDVAHAMAIGLVPSVPLDRVVRAGNTALAGAGFCLRRSLHGRIRRMTTRVVLQNADFASGFIEAVRLRPWA